VGVDKSGAGKGDITSNRPGGKDRKTYGRKKKRGAKKGLGSKHPSGRGAAHSHCQRTRKQSTRERGKSTPKGFHQRARKTEHNPFFVRGKRKHSHKEKKKKRERKGREKGKGKKSMKLVVSEDINVRLPIPGAR